MTDYKTKYGVVHYGGVCQDHYLNFETYNQAGPHTVFTLQRPAMKAFKAAEETLAKRKGWSPERIKREGHGFPIEVLPGTNRSCATQRALYARDPGRYANPNTTGHTRGLAIDVSQNQSDLGVINHALYAEGWRRSRPYDEPWHYSYGVTV